MRAHRRWTRVETELLLSQAKVAGVTALAKQLDRSTSSVFAKLQQHRLRGTQAGGRAWCSERPKTPPVWTEEKIAIVLNHQKLAYSVAHRHHRLSQYQVPLEELQGEALFALTEAAARFDMSKARTGSPIPYLSMVLWHALIQYRKFWCKRKEVFGRPFTDMDSSRPSVRGDSSYFDPVDGRERDPAEQVELRLDVQQLRSSLSPHLKRFFDLRMSGLTHKQIGGRMGITRQRVEQLQKQLIERGRKVLGVAVNEDV